MLFLVFTGIDDAAVHIYVHIHVNIQIYLWKIPRSGIAGSVGIYTEKFGRFCQIVQIRNILVLIPLQPPRLFFLEESWI